jgi:hypothetical protein
MSLEEIQKQEFERKTKKPAMGGKSVGKKVPLRVVKEEDTKNEWGMIEDKDEIDFNKLLEEENQKRQEQYRRDQELQRRLLEEELARQEEELLQKALQESLNDFNKDQSAH